MNEPEDFPCTGEPARASVALRVQVSEPQRGELEAGREAGASLMRVPIWSVDFYNEQEGA